MQELLHKKCDRARIFAKKQKFFSFGLLIVLSVSTVRQWMVFDLR